MKRFAIVGVMTILAALIMSAPALCENAQNTVGKTYPGLSSGPLESAKLAELPEGVVLRSGDLTVKQEDIDKAIASAPEQIREQLKTAQFFVLEQDATEKLLLAEAKAGGFQGEGEEAIKTMITKIASAATVEDKEVADFYAEKKDLMGGKSLEEMTPKIKQFLLQQKQQEIVKKHVMGISSRTNVEISSAWAKEQAEKSRDNEVDKARTSGKPSFVSFGAGWCGPCKQMAPIRDELKKKYDGKVVFVYVDVDKEKILAMRHGIRSIPVMVLYDAQGKEVFRHVGATTQKHLEAEIEKVLGK